MYKRQVDHLSWRAIFLINPILSIPTLWIAVRYLLESRETESRASLDWPGALSVFLGLGAIVYGLIAAAARGWGDAAVSATLVAGTALLLVFLWIETRSSAPMVPLGLFGSRQFSGVNILTLLLYGALAGTFFFVPFLIIQVHGYSAAAAGAIFVPFAVILGALSKWSGQLMDRFGARRPLIIGPTIAGVALLLLAILSGDGRYFSFVLPMVVLAFGMAITIAPLTTTVLNAVKQEQTGTASGINNAAASVAGLLVIAVMGLSLIHISATTYRAACNFGIKTLMVSKASWQARASGLGTVDACPQLPSSSAKNAASVRKFAIDVSRSTLGARIIAKGLQRVGILYIQKGYPLSSTSG